MLLLLLQSAYYQVAINGAFWSGEFSKLLAKDTCNMSREYSVLLCPSNCTALLSGYGWVDDNTVRGCCNFHRHSHWQIDQDSVANLVMCVNEIKRCPGRDTAVPVHFNVPPTPLPHYTTLSTSCSTTDGHDIP